MNVNVDIRYCLQDLDYLQELDMYDECTVTLLQRTIRQSLCQLHIAQLQTSLGTLNGTFLLVQI